MKEYKINIGESRAFITVLVYKNAAQMRMRIDRDGKSHDSDCMGMFAPSSYYDQEGTFYFQDFLGTMYLNEERLGSAVVSHECLHAAMACERFLNRFNMKYDVLEIDDNEERLCYLLSNICREVYNRLYDNQHVLS